MGETRVDLLHLLEDLRDAYPGALEETILTEIVANALDSGATCVRMVTHPAAAELEIVDDGSGMTRRDLARYHDIAASTKTRGQGIGFAGVGIKLGLLLCTEVITETRRASTHASTRWHLASRHRAPWKWQPAQGVVPERGTAVTLRLNNPLSPLLDAGFLEAAVRRHFQPLLDSRFDAFLAPLYRRGVRFEIDGRRARTDAPSGEIARLEVRLGRKRKPSAVGTLERHAVALPEDMRGIAIATRGKVIRRGWDWLGLTPTTAAQITGLIEAPALAEALTLNKADFIRSGARGALYLSYRKAIQESVEQQLTLWGDTRTAAEESRRRAARPVERDLERVLIDLASRFPLLSTLVERREGGQRRLPVGDGAGTAGFAPALGARLVAEAAVAVVEAPTMAGESLPEDTSIAADPLERTTPPATASIPLPPGRGPKRPGRYGLSIQFESREDDPEPGRLIDATVWINDAHPAYRRAVASRSEGYHIALSVGLALAPLAVEPRGEHAFLAAFLEHWGSSLTDRPRGRTRPS